MKYVYEKEEDIHYPCDVDRIVKVFEDRGHELSRNDAHAAWEAYSDALCAGWLILPDEDEHVFETAKQYLTETEC